MERPHSSYRPPEIDLMRADVRKNPAKTAQPLLDGQPLKTSRISIPINYDTTPPDDNEEDDDAHSTDEMYRDEEEEGTPTSETYLDDEGNILKDEFYHPLAQGDKLMNIKPANLWIAEQSLLPVPQKLFGGFWLEGELCLLYADTNMGKSILAVQIGDSISRGEAIIPFAMETAPAATLYIDFELSAKQFEMRYHVNGTSHQFSPDFYRAEYNPQKTKPDHYDTLLEYMYDTLAWALRNTEPKVLIIDNITCLSDGGQQAASVAVGIMKYLKTLQAKHRLSILVLAHTPKRDPAKPIMRDDLGGSKMLMNFADSAFAIGQSYADANLRYLKQVKQRSGSQQYGEDNVCLCKLVRRNGFLKYAFCGYGHEAEHLRRKTDRQRADTAATVTELHKKGLSQRQIAVRLLIGLATVNRIVAGVEKT